MRSKIGQQRQADIGRRRAVRHHRNGLLLDIVGRQPVVFRADQGFIKRPDLARHTKQEHVLLGIELHLLAHPRPANDSRDCRRQKPGEQERARSIPGSRMQQCQRHCRRQRQSGCEPHAAVASGYAVVSISRGIGRHPFEQAPTRHQHTPQCAANRIDAEKSVVRQ